MKTSLLVILFRGFAIPLYALSRISRNTLTILITKTELELSRCISLFCTGFDYIKRHCHLTKWHIA